ncbi:hypothetical protein L596_013734 [Steinernema carpocapsae]|uniref:RNA helicase n=1 Tax=Steinernema carpocapsae TaxID=34508 RepID=A0A4U5P135_STECR|nr:hypothetical protein L596_013734 [Steinernema carpocapsae]
MLKLSRHYCDLVQQLRNRVVVNVASSSFCSVGFRPLGDQKTLYHQQQRQAQRIGREETFERRRPSFNRGGFRGHTGGFDAAFPGQKQRFNSRNNYGSTEPERIDWNQEQLAAVESNFYQEQEAVKNRPQQEIDDWIMANQVTLKGIDIPRPVFQFSEVGFPEKIAKRLEKAYEKPSVIQSISWPIAMSGQDVISVAKTGSGKTLGFILPSILHTLKQQKRQFREGPSVVVLLPTRELAQQVEAVAREFCFDMGLSVACVFGGANRNPQAQKLERGVDMVIATPGRLNDFLTSGVTNLRRCTYLVLDEADRMLDMGFEPQIRQIISQIRPGRQTMMFSATWPKEVRALAADFQKNAAFLNVGSLELAANHNITQKVEVMEHNAKLSKLISLAGELAKEGHPKTLIFTETKSQADFLTRRLRHESVPALAIHGDKSQSERDWVLRDFKDGRTSVLIATNVVARGLDVDGIKYVINYDFPKNFEDYIHRIGRTGRRDNKGTSITFMTSEDAPRAGDLVKVMEEANQEIPEDLRELAFYSSRRALMAAAPGGRTTEVTTSSSREERCPGDGEALSMCQVVVSC